jgi:hypothetical protein
VVQNSQPDGRFFFGNIYCQRRFAEDFERARQLIVLHHSLNYVNKSETA